MLKPLLPPVAAGLQFFDPLHQMSFFPKSLDVEFVLPVEGLHLLTPLHQPFFLPKAGRTVHLAGPERTPFSRW